jgi:cysteine desulfurase/selenocysteine lyase
VAALSAIPAVRLIGTPKNRGAVVSFVVEGLHPQDVGTLLDRYGICVRVGHHCAQPALKTFGVDATVRASFGVYNTLDEVAFFAERLAHLVSRFT